MPNKQVLLDQIATDILSQNVCPDLAEQATQLVMGDGDPNARIVFIGEAPGKKEDLKGIPFVGAAGTFLTTMCQGIGLDRRDVYITNIVKYRPPHNRDPRADEKKAFWPFLVRQLQVIDPAIVVTLGRHSMEYFLPGLKIGQIHGQLQRVTLDGKEIALVPLFHPAAALYNGGLRQTLIDDFGQLPAIVDLITKESSI